MNLHVFGKLSLILHKKMVTMIGVCLIIVIILLLLLLYPSLAMEFHQFLNLAIGTNSFGLF